VIDAFCVFRRPGEAPRVGARRGERVLDLAAARGARELPAGALAASSLNALMALGPAAWRAARALDDAPDLAVADVELLLPFAVADYVDFFSSLDHATNLGRLLRAGGDPLLPNWRELPVGYHGRAGTVVVSGTDVVRPWGQSRAPGAARPVFGPSAKLDVELELGFVIATPSALGRPVPVERALEHVFGAILVNDWSARDLQAWEYQPLGPFLGKSFATSISPWVVPLDLLPRTARPPQDPEPLPYLREPPWAFDLALEIELNGHVVAGTNASHLYWSAAQQIAHLTANGASLRTGDLLATGTISGPSREQRGSLIELTWNAAEPLTLPDGSERTFLEDGDEVVLRGERLGEVRGRVVARGSRAP
jgi:fumarylacetoacetase